MTETWLIDARTFGIRPTGIGRYAFRHVERLLDERTPDTERKIILLSDVAESPEIEALKRRGCAVHTFGTRVCRSFRVIGYFRFVRRIARAVRPDVFWQPNNLQPFRLKGVGRVIVTMHDVFGLDRFSFRCAVWQLYYRLSFARTLRHATEVWYNSRETKRAVEAHSARARQLNGRVVPPPTEVFVPTPAEVAACRSRYGTFFLYVGNLERRKGADLLVTAYRRYREQGGRARLVFIGSERDVHPQADENVDVLGYVDERTKCALMVASVALIVPSRDEGYGMQVAEAAALGIRCLASDLPVFREINPRGRTVFPAGDVDALVRCMRQLQNHPTPRPRGFAIVPMESAAPANGAALLEPKPSADGY